MRYEAENAYLSSYQELSNPLAVGTAFYKEDALCSGGMKAVNLGSRADNDLQWRDVLCQQEGEYIVKIHCPSFPAKASLQVSANGDAAQHFRSAQAIDGTVTLRLKLHKGMNTIRLFNDNGPMPDIDYMDL